MACQGCIEKGTTCGSGACELASAPNMSALARQIVPPFRPTTANRNPFAQVVKARRTIPAFDGIFGENRGAGELSRGAGQYGDPNQPSSDFAAKQAQGGSQPNYDAIARAIAATGGAISSVVTAANSGGATTGQTSQALSQTPATTTPTTTTTSTGPGGIPWWGWAGGAALVGGAIWWARSGGGGRRRRR